MVGTLGNESFFLPPNNRDVVEEEDKIFSPSRERKSRSTLPTPPSDGSSPEEDSCAVVSTRWRTLSRCVFLLVSYFSPSVEGERVSGRSEKEQTGREEREKKEINERKRDTMGEGPG